MENKTRVQEIEERVINAIRFLSIDAVERAKSGHPGLPTGAAAMAFVLWDRHLRFNPKNPQWFNRDRFVLSAGHGSMLLYSLLYLTGFDLSIEEIKRFRQLNSKTPGHPEYGLTPGVEVTSGPLGQGFGNAVGMAIAEAFLAEKFNKPGFDIVDHFVYVLASDGDLMEGVSHEAAALAGHLGLGKLIVLWDNNRITIDGPTSLAWSEDVLKRFESLGWHTLDVKDGYDIEAVDNAIREAKSVTDKPTIISVRTHIGYGTPKVDTPEVHGSPLGEEAIKQTRKNLAWNYQPFEVPDDVIDYMRRHIERGKELESKWNYLLQEYHKKYPELWEEFNNAIKGFWTLNEQIIEFQPDEKGLATRKASQKVLSRILDRIPVMMGGSADLAGSNGLDIPHIGKFQKYNRSGRHIHFGIREHGMGAILNGMAYHGGVLPYGGTFLVFSDYMRPAIRLAAMSHLHVIFVFSHDSIGLGQDGPTHQPIEQLSSLRLIPDLVVLRPCDANETVYAWKIAVEIKKRPVALILTRQSVPILDRETLADASLTQRGGYILKDSNGIPDILLIATGSEVHLALKVHELLQNKGLNVRTVSMPSVEIFNEQPDDYRRHVIPPETPYKVAIEAGVPDIWYRFVGENGLVVGISRFGKSAPYQDLYKDFGLTPEAVYNKIVKHFGL